MTSLRVALLRGVCGWLAVATLGLAPVLAQAQTYLPGPAPSVGDIVHQTVETIPLPRTRTDIGIGEEVTCSIDPLTWQDTDYKVTASGQEPVQDTMGTVTWTAAGQGTVAPLTGNSTKLTANMDPGAVIVNASVADSPTKAIGPAVQQSV